MLLRSHTNLVLLCSRRSRYLLLFLPFVVSDAAKSVLRNSLIFSRICGSVSRVQIISVFASSRQRPVDSLWP